ncbi:hypothetical protein [Micromonospora cremea]|uniref:Uncharacterized protein n=1 Tax=Micromonospora cremea TaxID=709881 RepID=A0A1N5VK60_9ACTN|nr:hypothetical protein [Micromonospora cremea]SIM73119.1 hypothetical protein SAMN04489832_1680 [Micromonospora cremea]
METSGGGEADEPSTPAGGERPDVVMFEVATARRVGAQLRYNGGPWLAEIRYSAALLTMQQRLGGYAEGETVSRREFRRPSTTRSEPPITLSRPHIINSD